MQRILKAQEEFTDANYKRHFDSHHLQQGLSEYKLLKNEFNMITGLLGRLQKYLSSNYSSEIEIICSKLS